MIPTRPLSLVVAALGGQGGGVVSDWLVHVAKTEGYLAHATSVPGVAQRTGATIYYLEFFPRNRLPSDGRTPVMALMPHPGDVDVVLASELLEAGRAIQRGIVTRDKTALIASSHRVYSISEKAHLADGRADSERVMKLARDSAKRCVLIDMQAIASAHGSVISASMLGALAGSDALPFTLGAYRAAIEAGGIAVTQSLAAFDAAVQAAREPQPSATEGTPPLPQPGGTVPSSFQNLLARVPNQIRATATEGVRRLIDYQDSSYAHLYLQRLEETLPSEPWSPTQARLAEAVARCLAVWMSFEDTIRVADLKIRAARRERVRAEVAARADQLLYVFEFMKPRVEEICGTLPAPVGRWIANSTRLSRWLRRLTHGRRIGTSHVGGFLLLYSLACLRRYRRRTLRFSQEDMNIRAWLELVKQIAPHDCALAAEITECQTLVKGYGDTHERGLRAFGLITARARILLGQATAAERIRELRLAALADEEGHALQSASSLQEATL